MPSKGIHNANFYRVMAGEDRGVDAVLAALGVTRDDLDRYRDAGIDEQGMWVLCRTGGNNREYYPNTALVSHPWYVGDDDDDFDSTYALYRSKAPPEETSE